MMKIRTVTIMLGVSMALVVNGADSVFSPGYFWMWNAPIEPTVFTPQLDEMMNNGIMNVCIHPVPKEFRPDIFETNMSPDYMSDEYLKRYAEIVHYAANKGMSSYLYDEGGWPSGGACGLVMKSDTEGKWRHRILMPEGEDGYTVFVKPYGPGRGNYPSMIEKGATEKFIELTHERYKTVVGDEFGKAIRIVFTDEPSFTGGYGDGIAWTADFLEEFKARKGYDLTPYLGRLVRKNRGRDGELLDKWLDYKEVIGDLFVERFFLPIRDWCRANNLESCGHLSGEDNPANGYRTDYGHLFKDLRALDAPGIDVIWRQLYPETWSGKEISAPFPRYAASAAHYNGSKRVMCELFGIYGDSVSPHEIKWLTNYNLVRGVNMFVYAYRAVDTSRSWLTLFEPHFGSVSPLWPFMKNYYHGLHNLCAELAKGKSAVETVVFYDQRSFWSGPARAAVASSAQFAVAKALDQRQCEYDFADDEIFEKATIEGKGLKCGQATYTTVVVPSYGLMTAKARAKLEAFQAAGGKVLGMDRLNEVKPVCEVTEREAILIRAMKRIVDDQEYYFLVNEVLDASFVPVKINLKTDRPIAVYEPENDEFFKVEHQHGAFFWNFTHAGSALFVVGKEAEKVMHQLPNPPGNARKLASGWTIEPLNQHVIENDDFAIKTTGLPPKTAIEKLMDWRLLLGEHYAGTAKYVNRFEAKAGKGYLNLGKVGQTCSVKFNGKDLPQKFTGPYRWEVEFKAGENVLEVTVANVLGVLLSDELLREQIKNKHIINDGYERRQRVFEHSNNESGLMGPVTIY